MTTSQIQAQDQIPAQPRKLTHPLTIKLQAAKDELKNLRAEKDEVRTEIEAAGLYGPLTHDTLGQADSLDDQIAAVEERIRLLRIEIADAVGTTPGLHDDAARHGREAKAGNRRARIAAEQRRRQHLLIAPFVPPTGDCAGQLA